MFKKLFQRWAKRRPAETLIEVVMAVFIVALGSASATSLIVNAMQANSFSKDNLIALYLAVEGVEGVRNIRDTNWIRYGFDKTNCWNLDPDPAVGATCTAPYDQIPVGTYSADRNPATAAWHLRSVANPLDLNNPAYSATNEEYLLSFYDADGVDSTKDVYLPKTYLQFLGEPISGDSKFYRMVEITYDTGSPDTAEVMNVVVTVNWRQTAVHSVELSTTISNYQKVPTS